MAQTQITLTNSYVEIATGRAFFTVLESPADAKIFTNQSATTTAEKPQLVNPGDPLAQNEAVSTFMRTDAAGVTLIVETP